MHSPHVVVASLFFCIACRGTEPNAPSNSAMPSPVDDFTPVSHSTGSSPGDGGTTVSSTDAGTPSPGKPPAQFNDAGEFATPPTHNEVFCGPTSCDARSQVCCFDPPKTAACGARCDTPKVFACDGPEDCSNAERCCYSPKLNAGSVERLSCATACEMPGAIICHSHLDCPQDHSMCCRNDSPFGRCVEVGSAEPGDVCDL